MKLQKYLIIMLLAATTTGFLSSCSDNDNKGDAPRLFRPIASLETNNNTITATWDNISGATSYNLTLYKVTGTDEAGVSGSIFLNASETTLPSVTKSFKTNFTWTVVAEKTYPLDGLQELSLDEKELWNSPATGEFKITGQVGEDGVGDPRWLQ